MARVNTAPEVIDVSQYSVFLAGAIDMGAAVDWQAQVIEAFADYPHITLYNPRRAAFTPDTLDEQIEWELRALTAATSVLMWFPANTKAPIALLETGLFMQSGKLFVGAEPGFYRRRNLEMTCEFFGVPLYDSIEAVVAAIQQDYHQLTPTKAR
jgi:hypothetical protein